MKKLSHWLILSVLVLNLLPLTPSPAYARPTSETNTISAGELLPDWFAGPAHAVAASPLPAWFSGPQSQPWHGPLPAPARRTLATSIPLSRLSVTVTGPDIASLGSPVGAGEVYTATIRNTAAITAYSAYLTATHPTFFVHDGGDQLFSSGGPVPLNVVTGPGNITWTPTAPFDLGPGETITLNFRLRATCGAKSGQQMRVGIRYNADPPPAPPDELNDGGLNITTGRGNLVIKKEPAVQNLGTPDFGQPITWVVTVQNTGLGVLHDAVITDTGGISLSQPGGDLVPSVTITRLDINEIQTFTVVGTVAACNFTNVAEGSWTCGNLEGDATVTNPLTTTATVLFTPDVPRVDLRVASPLTFPYCAALTRTVVITLDTPGGPAGDFYLDTSFESDGYLTVLTPTLGPDWQYNPADGVLTYIGGSPTGTLAPQSTTVLTFQVRPQADYLCAANTGAIIFEPHYRDVCSRSPFTADPATLDYQLAQGQAPELHIAKSGPSTVSSGEIFTYQLTVWGQNPANISGTVNITDLLPSQFVLLDYTSVSTGAVATNTQGLTWTFDPPDAPATFSETLTYRVQAVVTQTQCGASQIVHNNAEAQAQATCPGCPLLYDSDQTDTAIQNEEGIYPGSSASGSLEACGPGGYTLANSYLVTGSTVITWTGAVFTEALGTAIGAGGLPGPVYLQYITGSLILTVNGTDYTAQVTPTVTPGGQLVIDLSPLDAAGAPTQNLTLHITYTVAISEASLNGAVELTFYDWTRLYLPNVSDAQGCAANNAFNQVRQLTIGRGDLSVSLAPLVLDKCSTNPVILTVHDNAPGRLTDHVVVTFTASSAQIATARNYTYTGSLASAGPITVTTDSDIGGGMGIITFTLPPNADLNGDGEIHFDIDLGCTDESDWHAGVTYLSRCALPHANRTDLTHAYRAPGLLLFATPLQYTVREKDAIWKFFLTNNGNLTATNVLVTNTIAGLAVYTYTTDDPGDVTLLTPLPITGSPTADIVFNVAQLAPGQQIAFTMTAQVAACTPLYVDIVAEHACFGQLCQRPSAHVSFNTPPPYLLTNNGETADLPMCDPGEVIFTTKNASADITLYQLDITETLRGLSPIPGAPMTMTIVDAASNLIVTTTAFTPQQTVSGTATLLTWRAISAPTEVATWFHALPPLYVVRVRVPVRTHCVPPNTPQSFAQASAFGPCGAQLGYTEDAITLQTLQPDMTVTKDGRVAGGQFGDNVYAAPGQTVTWRLEVDNRETDRSYVAHNVILSDTWPPNFIFVTATTAYSPVVDLASRTITWNIGDLYPPAAPIRFYITGTVATSATACAAQTINAARLTFGCDFDGCTSAQIPQDTANLGSQPDPSVAVTPGPLQTCSGDIPIVISNDGAPAYSATLTVTLPGGYVYSQTLSSGLTPTAIITDPTTPRFQWDVIPGRTGPSPYQFTLLLRVRNSAGSGTCPVDDGRPVTATLAFDNHPACTTPVASPVQGTTNLTVLSPLLNVTKTPATQTADVGDTITWTLTVVNTGSGLAENVRVTDVLGNNYTLVTATLGSDGATPIVSGDTITWSLLGPLAASGGNWTAQVVAQLLSIGDNRNVVTATAHCATGCTTATATDTAYTTLLQNFGKSPAVQTGTIGSLVVFTLTASLPDENALYENLTLTDTLPAGLGYVAAQLDYTYDGDGNDGGPYFVAAVPPTADPGAGNPGPVVWSLGDLSGTVQIAGVLTAVIRDIPANQAGITLINDLRLTYTDDAQPYVYTDTADVDILEPLLHIGKSYVTPHGCNATLFQDNFNDGDDTGWSGSSGWSVVDGVYQTTSGGWVRRYAGDSTWSDYSVSAMIRSFSAEQRYIGLHFRHQDSDNWYRFYWRNYYDSTYSPRMRLQRRVGGNYLTLDEVRRAYEPGRWYHVEIRAEGDHLRVYVDGERVLEAHDSSFTSGPIALYSGQNPGSAFDDILVTRLGDMACTVGANDLVTYTLTVSNQSRLPGYDLVITDALPAGMSLVTYTMQSDDPSAAVVAEPSPIPGATGVLTWGINHLTPTVPYTWGQHTAITLTVVLQVSDGITANTVLSNQASLAYSSQPGSGPVDVERDYSGGSHSTAVRTVNAGITKTVQFSPPPTATLGTLVTYTLIVPDHPISATLYDVVVTDTVDSHLYIESVMASGGTGWSWGWSGQVVTATFASIPHDTQAYVTVTARISHEWPSPAGDANAGDVITDVAQMSHATAPVTTSNQVSTTVGEPNLLLDKSVESSTGSLSDLDGTALLTYTLRLTNTGTSPAYSVHITDAVPAGISVTAQYGGDGRSGPVVGPGVLTWTVGYISNTAPANMVVLTYTARISQALSEAWLTNTVDLLYHSLTETIPGVRPYTATDSAVVETAPPTLSKATEPITLRVGDLVTYHLVFTVPAGTVGMGGDSFLRDALPPGIWYITDSETLTWTPSTVDVTVTQRISNTTEDPGWQVIRWYFAPITSTQDLPTVITLTFQAQAVGLRIDTLAPVWPDQTVVANVTDWVELWQRSQFIDNDSATNQVIQPYLSVDKDSTPPPGSYVGAGDRITYTLTVTNSGHGPAYDWVVSDTLPAGLAYVTSTVASTAPPTIAFTYEPPVGATGVLTWRVNALWGLDWNGGQPGVAVITVVAQVTDTIGANLLLTNTGAIPYYDSQPGDGPGPYSPDEREYTDGSDSVYHRTVNATLLKTVTPPAATLGDVVTYVIVVPSTPITATLYAVTVTDQLDGRLQLHTVTDGPDGTIVTAGNAFTVTYPSIPNSQQRTLTITAVLSDLLGASAGEVITNQAILRHRDGGPTLSNQPPFTVTEPSVGLNKTVQTPRDPLGAGDIVTYTLALSNTGTWPAYDLVITDSLPTGLSFVATTLFTVTDPPTATHGGDYPVWTVSRLNVGGQITIAFTARISDAIGAGLTLTNAAWGAYDSQPGDVPGERDYPILTDTVPVDTGYPVLSLTKTATPTVVEAGDLLTYTLAVTNTGIVSATNVVVTDAVPANTGYLSCGPAPCGQAGGVVSWTLGTLGIGDTRLITLVVQLDTPLPDGIYIYNTGWVTSTEGVTTTDTISTPVGSAPILHLVKRSADANGPPLRPGDRLTYTLVVSNTGNEAASNVTVSDTVPAHTTYVPGSIAGGDSQDDSGLPLLSWTINALPLNVPVTLTFAVTVNIPLTDGLTMVNSAWVTSTEVPTPTTGTVTGTVTSAHALTVTKSAAPAVARPGGLLTYTLAYTVTGDEPVYGVTVSDAVPAHTTFVTATLPHTRAGSVVTWSLGDLLPPESGITQATGTLTMVVLVDSPLLSGTLIHNAALISDTSGLTDTDQVDTPVTSSHRLTVTKSAAPSPAQAGGLLTYTLAYAVGGNEPAPNAVLSDSVPAHTTYWACAGGLACGQAGGLVTWTLGTLNPPTSGTVTLVVRVDSPLLSGTLIHNAVLISDTSGLTDTDQVDTPVTSSHRLTVTKSAAPSPAQAGGLLTYTLAYAVGGNEPAPNAVLSDSVPAHTTFVTATLPHTRAGSVVTWTLGTLNPPTSGAVTLVVRVDSALLSGTLIRNAVLISDTSGLTDTDAITTPVLSVADVAVAKADAPDPLPVGAPLTYTLVVTNYGPSDAERVVVTDTLPPEVAFITATPPVTVALPELAWALGPLPPGAVRYLTITVRVQPWVTQSFSNGVVVTSTTPDDRPENNDDQETTTPLLPDVVITKTVSVGQAAPNMPLTYTLLVRNTGQVTLDPLAVTDTLPSPDFYYVTGSGSPPPDNVAGQTLVWQNLGPLNPGGNVTVSFAVTVTPGITGVYRNVALSAGDTPSGVITDTDEADVVIRDPSVAIAKEIVAPGAVNGVITFAIHITNTGPSVIDILPLLDYYQGDIAYVGGTPPADSVDPVARLLTWNDLTTFFGNMAPGQSFLVHTVFAITATGTTFTATNHVTVTDAIDLYDNPANEDEDEVVIINEPTAVELLYLRASGQPEGVLIEWATLYELESYGFELYRAVLNQFAQAAQIAFLPAQGGMAGATYAYTDREVMPGELYWYWLVEVDTAGQETIYGPVSATAGLLEDLWHRVYLPMLIKH